MKFSTKYFRALKEKLLTKGKKKLQRNKKKLKGERIINNTTIY